jgi:hypothetical protein
MARKLCSCGQAQAVRPGGLCNKCFAVEVAAASGETFVTREVLEVQLEKIRIDGGSQMRERIDDSVVADYAEDINLIMAAAPAVVFFDGTEYWLGGGFHRFHACVRAGRKTLRAEVHQGGQFDAFVYALGDNASHGLRRSSADKRKAVTAAIAANKERSLGWSERQVCDRCAVSHNYIANMRLAESKVSFNGKKDSEGAELPVASSVPEVAAVGEVATETVPQAAAIAPKATPPKGGDFAFMADEGEEPTPPAAVKAEPTAAAVDGLGKAVEGKAAESFAVVAEFKELEKLLKQAAALVNGLANRPGSEKYTRKLQLRSVGGKDRFYCSDLKNATFKVQDQTPYAAHCPECNPDCDGPNRKDCGWCNGMPYLEKPLYERVVEFVTMGKKKAAAA